MKKIGLTSGELSTILAIFTKYPPITKVTLFGSRAKGVARSNSDIDLAITGISDELQIEELAQKLDNLPLPYKFDVKSISGLKNPALKEHIHRVGVQIYP
jgi:predicted nucleotidyltransferase